MASGKRKKAKTNRPGEIFLSPEWGILGLLEKQIYEVIEAGSRFTEQPGQPALTYDIYQSPFQKTKNYFWLFISYGYKSIGLEYACIERKNIEAYLAKRSPPILENGIGESDISDNI